MRRRPRLLRPFADVRWSSPHALADTLANLDGRTVAFLATLGDVDDADDLHLNSACFGRRVMPAAVVVMPAEAGIHDTKATARGELRGSPPARG
jgi:hypothetical protein